MIAPSKPAVLLVDGYNVIGAHPKFKALRDHEGLEEARRALIELLANYSAYHHYETDIVFDAHYQDRQGSRETVTQYLAIAYTHFNQTADSHIERACALFFREDIRRFEKRLIVATSDRAQWMTAVGYGAEWMSSPTLILEAMTSGQQLKRHRPSKQPKTRFLSSGLDETVQSRLAQLRQDLLNRGS
jgi:uncharacterized protein